MTTTSTLATVTLATLLVAVAPACGDFQDSENGSPPPSPPPLPPPLPPMAPANPAPPAAGLVPPCGTGTWRPGSLEIHHIDVGQADSTLIVGPTGRTLLVDAGEARWDSNDNARRIGDYVRQLMGCARLDHVLVTHFHSDHIGYLEQGGLWHLVTVQGFEVGKTLHRDFLMYLGDASGTLRRWRDHLLGAGRAAFRPEVIREGTGQVDLGPGVSFAVVATDGGGTLRAGDFSAQAFPPNENDYSVAAVLRFGAFDYFVGGDLSGEMVTSMYGYAYHDVEAAVAGKVGDVDVYRVSHHGSDHSSSPVWLAQLDPEVSIVSAGDGNSYGHPRPAAVERLLATGALYLTERGDPRTGIGAGRVVGHVVVRTTDGLSYTVAGDAYRADDPVRVDADGDGYFREADPDDSSGTVRPTPRGGCDPQYQSCANP